MDRNTQQQAAVVALLVLLSSTHATGLEVTPPDIAVEEGDVFTFDCDGDISSHIWRLPNGTELGPNPGPAGSRIQAQNRLLKFTQVMQGDDGTYICFDGSNPSRSASARLAVYFPPRIQRENHMPVQEIHLDQSVLIKCEVNLGNPIADLTWYKDNRLIDQSDPRITVMDNGLMIAGVEEGDSGEYRCFVHNEVGHDELTTTVAFRAIPQFVNPNIDTTVTVMLYKEFELDCRAAGAPNPSYTWYSPAGSSSALGSTNRGPYLADSSVGLNDGGEYQCSARNEVGAINRTFTVIIVASPSPSINYLNDTISLGEPVTLSCPVNGIPTPEIQWYFYNSETHKEAPITEGNRFSMKPDGTLDITKFEASDFGSKCFLTLLCVGHNDYGESRQYYKINLTPSDCHDVTSMLQPSTSPLLNNKPIVTTDQNVTVIALIATGCTVLLVLLVLVSAGFIYIRRSCNKKRKSTITVMTRTPQSPGRTSIPPNPLHTSPAHRVHSPLQPTTTSQNLPIANHTSRNSNRPIQQGDSVSSRLPQSYIPHSDPHLNASPNSHPPLFMCPQQHPPARPAHAAVPAPVPPLSGSPDRQHQLSSHYGRLQHFPSHRNASLASTSSASSTTPLLTQSSSSSSEDEPVFTEGEGNGGASLSAVSTMQSPHEGLALQSVVPCPTRHPLTATERGLLPWPPARATHSNNSPPQRHFSRASANSNAGVESHSTHLMSCPECMQQMAGGTARDGLVTVFDASCPECAMQGLQRESFVEHRQLQPGPQPHHSCSECLVEQTPAESTLAHCREQQSEYLQVVGGPVYETIQ